MKKIIVLLICLLLTACINSSNPSKKRAEIAKKNKGKAVIGVVIPKNSNLIDDAVKLAINEISHSKCNYKIKIVKKFEGSKVDDGIKIAEEFADNLNIVGVIGHSYSYLSIPASVIYEYYGIVMVSPVSSAIELTSRNFKMIFRTIPKDSDSGKQLAQFAYNEGFKSMLVYYINDEYGKGISNTFVLKSNELGIEIIDRLSYNSSTSKRIFFNDFKNWKNAGYNIDAIFLVSRNAKKGADIIKQIRKAGFNVPILGSDGLASKDLIKNAGIASENTIVPSYFNPQDKREVVQNFVHNFKKFYGKEPDMWSALYYDAVKLLVYAITSTRSSVPEVIANFLHNIKNFEGVTGKISFTKAGDVKNKKLYFKIVKNGKFHFIKK